ncbi:LTA synthase family protein [Bacillus sp. NTK034]|uniref:LTA synthase family protein n=1 Tax=Bacillus sp. NTK034 TaxID=2802176 RepID=UPI001A8F4278|nr:LTA synthase family protein [Bacillus sp. NTK034]MBN8204291.1 LTA synthase family protein [Bacillus sp. NTK034]
MKGLNLVKSLLNKRLGLFYFAALLFWIKTYLIYLTEFNLGVNNGLQQFLLVLNPVSSALLFLGIALLFKGKKQHWMLLAINFVLTFFLYANVAYYRFFNDFITVPVLFQTQNFGKVGGSAVALLEPSDILYFFDTILLIALILSKRLKVSDRLPSRSLGKVYLAGLLILGVNVGLAEADRPQLLTRSFDRNYLVKYLGAFNFAIYDIVQNTRSSAQRVMADSSDITTVENYTLSKHTEKNLDYFGVAKGMNVIYISMESFQNFLIGYKLHGEEVTPFLNSLAKDPNTIYFPNFFHQTAQGKTSDAEFLMENSLYPLPQGSVFTTKAQNTYQGLPAILKGEGYYSAVFHGNYKSFWNREEMYKSLGYDMFYDATYYNMREENVINYGLEDKPFLKETIPYLQSIPKPFYTKLITLSNHFPYPIDEADQSIEPAETGDETVDGYFQTARYLDEALKQFFEDLKISGLDKNTMVVMYGDHYGISENRKNAMSKVLNKDINDFEQAQLQRVPLFIYAPGLKGFVNETYGGEVDVRPTILNLLGVDTTHQVAFGTDLLSENRDEIVAFRNGDYITDKVTSVKGKIYDNGTGQIVEDVTPYQKYSEIVKNELELSDKVVYGDLLRFHKLSGIKTTDKTKLDYTKADHFNEEWNQEQK